MRFNNILKNASFDYLVVKVTVGDVELRVFSMCKYIST